MLIVAGLWRVHAYQYEPGHSTFIVEAREETWRAACLDKASEAETVRFCEALFAAELDGHVAAVRDREEHESSVAPPVDAKSAECQVTHDAPGHDDLDAYPKAQLHIDATTAQRACPQ